MPHLKNQQIYNMKLHNLIIAITILACTSCHSNNSTAEEPSQTTQAQQKLLDAGWTFETPCEDLSKDFGIEPVYGTQDNYFDISIGNGCNVAVKIMDVLTNKCIRYVYVPEGGTTTVPEIPQGVYYLKLAYGQDWMELVTDSITIGKFSKNVSYERSQDTFDFGIKNSREERNYKLEINVIDSKLGNNFQTTPINEEEFMK